VVGKVGSYALVALNNIILSLYVVGYASSKSSMGIDLLRPKTRSNIHLGKCNGNT